MFYKFYVLLFPGIWGFNPSDNLFQVLSDILYGPLYGKCILIAIHSSSFQYASKEEIMFPFKDFPIYLVYIEESNSINLLEWPLFKNQDISVVFITGKYPEWLNRNKHWWYFTTTIIINVNPLLNSEDLLKSRLIQRSRNILLVETFHNIGSNTTLVGIYTSRPFFFDSKGRKKFKFSLGLWNKTKYLTFDQLFPSRFPSFNGELLHVASDKNDFPFVFESQDGTMTGVSIFILETLGSVLNFTFTTTQEAMDGEWGKRVNESWRGLLKDIFDERKNLTINYFAITQERWVDFDSSTPYFYEGFGFALRMPLPMPPWTNLFHPLKWNAWVSILAVLLFFPPLFFFIVKFSFSAKYTPSLQEVYFDILKVR